MTTDKERELFEQWAIERGWNIDRVHNPSGFVEFKNYDTMKLWVGFQAARKLSEGELKAKDEEIAALKKIELDFGNFQQALTDKINSFESDDKQITRLTRQNAVLSTDLQTAANAMLLMAEKLEKHGEKFDISEFDKCVATGEE